MSPPQRTFDPSAALVRSRDGGGEVLKGGLTLATPFICLAIVSSLLYPVNPFLASVGGYAAFAFGAWFVMRDRRTD